MINNLQIYLTSENIYLFANYGVLPFWFLLIFFPQQSYTRFLVHSVVAPLLLAIAYVFVAYKIFLDGNIFTGFNLYLGLEDLYAVFSDEAFLLTYFSGPVGLVFYWFIRIFFSKKISFNE